MSACLARSSHQVSVKVLPSQRLDSASVNNVRSSTSSHACVQSSRQCPLPTHVSGCQQNVSASFHVERKDYHFLLCLSLTLTRSFTRVSVTSFIWWWGLGPDHEPEFRSHLFREILFSDSSLIWFFCNFILFLLNIKICSGPYIEENKLKNASVSHCIHSLFGMFTFLHPFTHKQLPRAVILTGHLVHG